MPQELNPAQLRMEGMIKDINMTLVNNKANILETEIVFSKILEYQKSLAKVVDIKK